METAQLIVVDEERRPLRDVTATATASLDLTADRFGRFARLSDGPWYGANGRVIVDFDDLVHRLTVLVHSPLHRTARVNVHAGATVQVTLERLPVCRGVVRDSDGHPVRNAGITTHDDVGWDAAVTNAHGRFTIGFDPGECRCITVSAEGYRMACIPAACVRAGRVVVVLERGEMA